ncbi:MAG: hypothetical protein AAF074_20935, partial [Pseudomonadota bacterium]
MNQPNEPTGAADSPAAGAEGSGPQPGKPYAELTGLNAAAAARESGAAAPAAPEPTPAAARGRAAAAQMPLPAAAPAPAPAPARSGSTAGWLLSVLVAAIAGAVGAVWGAPH